MALQTGLDVVAIVSFGVWTETYGVGEEGNIANLIASFGYIEDAPDIGGWMGKVNTVEGANIASVNTVLRANITTINTA